MSTLTPIQSQVLAALLVGKSISAAARENGIHRSTIYNWRQQHPSFVHILDQARARHRATLYDLAQDLAEQSLEAVAEALASDDLSIRLRGAQIMLRTTGRSIFKLPQREQDGLEMEALADSTPRVKQLYPDLTPDSFNIDDSAPEPDTIRQNSTLFSQPRNARCSCGSGLKYKRCCGSVTDPAPALSFSSSLSSAAV
jgi:transposase-like protein